MYEEDIHAPLSDEDKSAVNEALDYCFASAAIFGSFLGHSENTDLSDETPDPDELDTSSEAPLEMDPDHIEKFMEPISKFKENPDPSFQFAQIHSLLRPDIKALFGESSALYSIFHQALLEWGIEGETIEQQITSPNRQQIVLAWILSRQAFAIRHYQELYLMLDSIVMLWRDKQPKPLSLSEISDKDIVLIKDFCRVVRLKQAETSANKNPVEGENGPASLRSITEIVATGNLVLPTSKAFRNQIKIAAAHNHAVLDVGRGAIIKASITGADGAQSINLTRFEMDIEATIGQLFQENDYQTITITPAQIYRKYAAMDPDANVSPESIQKTIEAMDKLIMTPAILDFTQQIEKHTRLKRRSHFDYENRSRKGTLITGVHDKKRSATYKGLEVEDSFTIFDMPMFYAYSYAIGQLTTVPAHLLTGEPVRLPGEKKIRGKKPLRTHRLTSEDIGLHRYLLEQIEYHKGLREKRFRKLRDTRQQLPDRYEAFILFASVAEDIGYDINTPKRARMLREQVYTFLQEQAMLKNIKAAEYHLKGKAYVGVKITL